MTAAWLLTFWLFAVGWFCCCASTEGHACTRCIGDSGPASASVTFGGIVDGACNCDTINTTYIVPADGTDCTYYGSYSVDGTCTVFIWATLLTIGTNYGWQVEIHVACNSMNCVQDIVKWRWDSGAGTQLDCSAARTLAFYSHTTFGTLGPFTCDQAAWSSTTCQVN